MPNINTAQLLTIAAGVLLAGAIITAARKIPSGVPGASIAKKAADVATGEG